MALLADRLNYSRFTSSTTRRRRRRRQQQQQCCLELRFLLLLLLLRWMEVVLVRNASHVAAAVFSVNASGTGCVNNNCTSTVEVEIFVNHYQDTATILTLSRRGDPSGEQVIDLSTQQPQDSDDDDRHDVHIVHVQLLDVTNFCYRFALLGSLHDQPLVRVDGGTIPESQIEPLYGQYFIVDPNYYYFYYNNDYAWQVGACSCLNNDTEALFDIGFIRDDVLYPEYSEYSTNVGVVDWFVEDVANNNNVVLSCAEDDNQTNGSCAIQEWYLYRKQHCLPKTDVCYRLVTFSSYSASSARASFHGEMIQDLRRATSKSFYFGDRCQEFLVNHNNVSSFVEVFAQNDISTTSLPVRYQLVVSEVQYPTEDTDWPSLSQRYNNSSFKYTSFEIPKDSCMTIDPFLDDFGEESSTALCRVSLDGVVYMDSDCSFIPRRFAGNCDDRICKNPETESFVNIQATALAASMMRVDSITKNNNSNDDASSLSYELFHDYGVGATTDTKYVALFCVPRGSCTLLYDFNYWSYMGYFNDNDDYTVVRVDGIETSLSRCMTIDGYSCTAKMTRLANVGCPALARRLRFQAVTALFGIVAGFGIAMLLHMVVRRYGCIQNAPNSNQRAVVEMVQRT